MKRWVPAYVGLGSNLGEPIAEIRGALRMLNSVEATTLVRASRLYRSEPQGVTDQPQFINAVAGLLTRLPAPDLLARLHAIERSRGRDRSTERRWGPRRLDLDLLLFGNLVLNEGGITVPHPRMSQRNFVLFPLAEIAPDLIVPGLGRVRDMAVASGRCGLMQLVE